ncbi:PepSY-associated TM helix domain-containing protein [Chitinophaga solisilvae]|uniref:PepSY-associated TM helix domain-containing protein n=1 Tax=Chitinophaga solisilvae TaxID=1233460 RepID=UPI00136F9C88|nr:PepSY-associated TM helix domain-containing protein [Chitinophaga solisilvae]
MKKLFKKVNAWLHLWLGLVSGILVFVISITGCFIVFEQELKDLLNPELRIAPQEEHLLLPPSRLYETAAAAFPGREIYSVWYHGLNRAAHISLAADSTLYVNPYTGALLAVKPHHDFFSFMEEGHTSLWMGRKIGHAVVSWSTFIFFLLLLSGIVLWFPKKWNKAGVNNSFKVKWKAKWKRLNYDLHNVLGFYALLVAFVMAATGMIMGLSWFSKSVYWLTGGKTMERREAAHVAPYPQHAIRLRVDEAWNKVRHEIAMYNKHDIIASFPDEEDEPIYLCTDMKMGIWRDLYMDPNNLELLPSSNKRITDLPFAGQLRKANYGLHVGAIGGFATKLLYFLGSLICASLPVTGFYIWWHRGKKSGRKVTS